MSEALDRAKAKIEELRQDAADIEALVAERDAKIAELEAQKAAGATQEELDALAQQAADVDARIDAATGHTNVAPGENTPPSTGFGGGSGFGG